MTIEFFRFLVVVSTATIAACIALVHQRARGRAEAVYMQLILWSELLLTCAYLAENLSTSLQAKLAWDSVQLFFDGAMATSFVMLCSFYAGRAPARPRLTMAGLLSVPLVAALTMLTSPWHQLTRRAARLTDQAMPGLSYPFELLDYLTFAEMYALLFLSIGWLILSGYSRHRIYRTQISALIFSVALPALAGSLSFVPVTILGERDLTPFFFATGAVVSCYALLRARLFELVPMARDIWVQSQADAVLVVDDSSTIVDANPAAEALVRAAAQVSSAIGRTLESVLPAWASGEAKAHSEGHRIEMGPQVWELRRFPVARTGALLVGRDITALAASERSLERVNHELEGRVAQRSRELERANDKFRAIFVNAHHYICLLDPLGHLLAANRVTLEKADVTTEDALGGRFEDLAWWQASQLGLASMLAALEAAQTGRFSRFEATMGSGTLLLDCSFKPILKDGVVELIVWEAQDITEARSAERERTRRQAERQHAERMEMLGRLAGGVAHDFNNLLTIVLAATAVLRQDELGEDGTDALNDIEEAAASATLVTRQLLGLSRRPGAGAARPIDVHDAVTRMSKLLARVLGERHGLQLELCPGTPHVLIDAGRLEQCVMNLVVNARDAMPQGGVVTVRTRVAPLRGQNLSSGDYLVISVEDHGEGIAPELQAKIFDAFFTTKASGQGTGLGLSTVQEIVSSAQGTVTVTSTAGEGTTFELHFPVCDPARIKADPAIDHETTGHEVVVLVEDVAQLRELVGRELRRLGYDMHLFATAEQAIEGLRGVSFDLLVTDIILPGQDGVQLVARLQTERGAFPVVYTTGYSGDAALDLHDDAKNQVLLYKPYRPLALASTIRNLLTPSDPST